MSLRNAPISILSVKKLEEFRVPLQDNGQIESSNDIEKIIGLLQIEDSPLIERVLAQRERDC